MSVEQFARQAGVSRQSISPLFKQKTISDHYKKKACLILGVPTDVFTKWKVEGVNPAINEFLSEDNPAHEYDVTNLHKDKVPGKKDLPETSIPVFNDGGSAGHAELYQDFKERPQGFIRVPGYEDCDFATYAYGHSMYPIIESGALILCRKTQSKQMILWGELYYIITNDYRLIKRLQKGSSKEMVLAISENEEKRKDGHTKFEPIEIHIDDIKDLYLIKGIIKKIQI